MQGWKEWSMRPKLPPARYDSKVISIDDSAAKRVPGYVSSLALEDPSGTVPGWVMVFAESFIAANRAADLVKVAWRSGKATTVSERNIQNRAAELIADSSGGSLLVDDPGVDAVLASTKQKIERTYTASIVMHCALELAALAAKAIGKPVKKTGPKRPFRQIVARRNSASS
jgi:isoquinoline 1-oxidoreductase beta subunit